MDQILFDIEQEFADTYAHYGELPNIQQGMDDVEKAYKELWLESHSDDADQQYVKAMNVAVSALRIMHLLNEQEAKRLCDVNVCDGFHGNMDEALNINKYNAAEFKFKDVGLW